jgi:hypothetical protein
MHEENLIIVRVEDNDHKNPEKVGLQSDNFRTRIELKTNLNSNIKF